MTVEVSLLMAAYEPRPTWLLEAVESALAQEGCELELVVVDDGSTTPVADLVAEISDPRLRVVRVEHGGHAHARNASIREARAPYLRFIDADDALEPWSTRRLLDLCGGRDDVIAYGATTFCDADLRPQWTMVARVQGDGRVPCLLGRFPARPVSMLFPRRVVDLAGDWDTSLAVSSDWDWVARALEHATVRGETETATFYRKHGGSATGADTAVAAGRAAAALVAERFFERHPELRGRLERRAEAARDAAAARVLATRGRPLPALAAAARSLRRDPTALVAEVTQALPAVRGKLVARAKRA